MSLANIQSAVESLIARTEPRSAVEVSAYEWRESIVPRILALGFDARFIAELELSAEQRAAKDECESLLVGAGAIVALTGPRGTGKTSIAAQIACERTRAWVAYYSERDATKRPKFLRPSPRYFKTAKLVAKYKSLYADYGSIDGPALQESLEALARDCGLVVIDEWHECEDQKMRDRVLVDLIDRRYASLNDTIIISNQTAKEFATTTHASILSRLEEHGRIIPCRWTSFRTQP